MRVAIDMISAGGGFAPAAGGMTNYYEALADNLPEVPGVDELIAFVPPRIEHARITPGPKLRLIRCRGLGGGRPGRVAYEQLRLPALVAGDSADVLLSTHNVKPIRWRGPSAVVLQSMQYFFLPDRVGAIRRAYLRAAVPRSLRAADRVIAVSEAARGDAIEIFGLEPESVVAVHHGCPQWATEAAGRFARDGTPQAPPPLDPGCRYVLNVSSLYGLKNHRRLIEAFAMAITEHSLPHELVIAGQDADVTAAELARLAAENGIADRVKLLGPYPQDRLPALFANAEAIAYPSLYETFGFPVLEAFAFGRPVLTSDLGGAAEVAGDAALTVDPNEVEEIADGLGRLLADAALRDSLRTAGTRRLRQFSWERCANATATALREAIEAH